ncbi:hypothetical protein ACIBI9_60450 [Nonomuraea sp. NPDC050451]|uniref:hypothetical protein n=1 Tax=Nonomuraea sp. NPDC050451 TaxID=3364364 RepID=UPI0037AF6C91
MGFEGDRLAGSDLGVTVTHQVDGDAPPQGRQLVELVAPQVAVDDDAVHEQGHRPLPGLGIGDPPRRRLNTLADHACLLDLLT